MKSAKTGKDDHKSELAIRPMSAARLAELEWAAVYVKLNKPRLGCRCHGHCGYCAGLREQAAKLSPAAILELIAEVKKARGLESAIEGEEM